jgi:hypothetical protein
MSNTASKIPVKFYACSRAKAEQSVRANRRCDQWLTMWPTVDPNRTPLAISYDNQIQAQIESEINDAIASCEQQRLVSEQQSVGLSIRVSSKLEGSSAGGSASNSNPSPTAKLSVAFSPGSPDRPCPMLPRELFTESVGFNYQVYGGANGNMSWMLQDPVQMQSDPYFDLYGRTMRFVGAAGNQYLGQLTLMINKLVDLSVQFTGHPIPSAVASRVNTNQALNYQVSSGSGYFNIAAVFELTHLDSGAMFYQSIHGDQSPGYLPPWSQWPSAWDAMSPNAQGLIEHGGFTSSSSLIVPDPAYVGLPSDGEYLLRVILLAFGYNTGDRWVTSSAAGQGGDGRMSWQPLFFSHMPSVISYNPGLSEGLMPPFELQYSLGVSLATGIELDAVFDLKYITTFRFVVKLVNHLDFPVGLIVQASGWQAWVLLQPGQTRFLAGATSVSGMNNSNAYPLHPDSPVYGWNRAWGNASVQMDGFGNCKTAFNLYLTAPNQPDTVPANLPQKKAVLRWTSDPGQLTPQVLNRWGAIKLYSPQGQFDYPVAFPGSVSLKELRPSITKPEYQSLLNPVGYFQAGYSTPAYDYITPWYKTPWPIHINLAGFLQTPIMVSGEEKVRIGNQDTWVPFSERQLPLPRAMVQQVAAALGVSEYVVMDGDDLRWFELGPGGSWHNLLWIDRFYGAFGNLVDGQGMRTAFQTVINANGGEWSDYRNLVIHPNVRFGTFLDNGASEVGDYLLGPEGTMVEVGSFTDLGTVSSQFKYLIKPQYQ